MTRLPFYLCIFFVLTGAAVPAHGFPGEPSGQPVWKTDTTYLQTEDLSRNLEPFDPQALSRSVELIGDREFTRGAYLIAPPEGQRVVERILDFGYPPSDEKPLWDIAQWASKQSLVRSEFSRTENGDRTYRNPTKSLTVNADSNFRIELNGYAEYGDTPRKAGEPWPHLYISQGIASRKEACIPLSKCEHLYFTLDGRRDFCRNYMGAAFDPGLHTIHVVLTLVVQVRNPRSPFHGKYLNVQLPVYDYRYDFPPASYTMDQGKPTTTGMFIYSEAGEKVWDGTFKDGKWHRAQLDILPILGKAVERWTQPGGTFEQVNKRDLHIADFIMGWECEGTFHGCMSFRNLSLKAVPVRN